MSSGEHLQDCHDMDAWPEDCIVGTSWRLLCAAPYKDKVRPNMIAAAPVNFAAFQSPGCTDSHSRLRLEISSEDSEQRHVLDALGCFKPLTRKKTRPEVVHVPCRHRRTEQAEEDRQDQGRIWASNALKILKEALSGLSRPQLPPVQERSTTETAQI